MFKYERDDDPSAVTPDEKFIPRLATVVANQCKPVTASLSSKGEDREGKEFKGGGWIEGVSSSKGRIEGVRSSKGEDSGCKKLKGGG